MSTANRKRVFFRFYAELNDFISAEQRMVTFAYFFWGTPSVKNAIQALGVPHTEVDLVLVNGNPVDFSYRLKPDDHISVYPVFESLDISTINPLRIKPLRDLQFIVDANIGKLAKYMRMLGFDTLYDNQFEDPEIISISIAEKRIILTRDLEILKQNRVTRGYYLRSQDPKEQLREVVKRFDLISNFDPFSRCMECNGRLICIEKNKVRELVDSETWDIFDEFYKCKACRRIYWKGSHYDRMLGMIEDIKALMH